MYGRLREGVEGPSFSDAEETQNEPCLPSNRRSLGRQKHPRNASNSFVITQMISISVINFLVCNEMPSSMSLCQKKNFGRGVASAT